MFSVSMQNLVRRSTRMESKRKENLREWQWQLNTQFKKSKQGKEDVCMYTREVMSCQILNQVSMKSINRGLINTTCLLYT